MHTRGALISRQVAGIAGCITLPLALACGPSGDLDAHARGSGAGSTPDGTPASEPSGLAPGAVPSQPAPVNTSPAPAGSNEQSTVGGLVPPPPVPSDTGDAGAPPEQPLADAAAPAEPAPTDPPAEPPVLVAPPLPDDLIDAPVAGEIVFSDEAEWEVDGVFEPTFEIHTPTASYWVVKPLGTIVSIEDGEPAAAQWIAFSSGFRPLRGVPSFPAPPATRVTTVRDDDSQTPTHLRLTAASDDGQWQWVWDFYVTHVTFTVNRAPLPFGFAYQGVPGGSLGAEDRLGSNDGAEQGARNSFNADLAGPVEWAYLADTTLGRSLFAMQHRDDDLPERYQVRDNDTSLLSFGNGQLQILPQRFSLGLIPSVSPAAIAERVEFVAAAIR
jgi:hypothetical protein